MTFPTHITKIAFAGDWHDNYRYMFKAVRWAQERGVDAVVQVGDFGFWRNSGKYDEINEYLVKHDMFLMFIDGNHENFDELYKIPVNEEGYREIRSRIFHLPRGFRWEWYFHTFTALGGAHSLDKMYRKEGVDWWPEEDITADDMAKTIAGGATDFLITHDAPTCAMTPLEGKFPHAGIDLLLSEMSRWMLDKVCYHIQPKYLIHGHYHVKYQSVTTWYGQGKGYIHGLNCDGNPLAENLMLVDLTDLQI